MGWGGGEARRDVGEGGEGEEKGEGEGGEKRGVERGGGRDVEEGESVIREEKGVTGLCGKERCKVVGEGEVVWGIRR